MNVRSISAKLTVCTSVLMIASLVANAGPLAPPAGPVVPTNKTLSEVEPRIAINATNTPGDADSLFKITQPGSYYLTGNITGVAGKIGIEIASSGVTLDLMGFELLGAPTSLDGVSASVVGTVNVHIRNGSVRAWGGYGVNALNAANSSLRDLLAQSNAISGLAIGDGGLVEACAAQSNGGNGIFALAASTIHGNAAQSNASNGISASTGCTVIGNTARFNSNIGISVNNESTVSGNTASSNAGDGIFAGSASTVSGNTASRNTADGVRVSSDCFVLNNTCDSNGFGAGNGAGIHVTSADTRVEANAVTDNDRGIDVDTPGNLIIRNSASGNAVNYDIVPNNRYGPIIDISVGGTFAVIGSSAPSTVSTADPWANFSY